MEYFFEQAVYMNNNGEPVGTELGLCISCMLNHKYI
jgi:hypothetical protein